ncbi:uncharacterized protein LOC105687230 [Athalia rosae]|uniref:uncharacterized protein LOC105687230 n=1 Tax=Athalia rosae TaxID=37344 RepID=UPI0020348854|nr:uncharacterized protein LOC105687230 [Athalia rosae]
MRLLANLFLFCLIGREGFGAKILVLLPFPGRSHLSITSSLTQGLAKKGHDVTAFVPHATGFSAPNYKEINYKATPLTENLDVMRLIDRNFVMGRMRFHRMGTMTTEMALNTTEVRDLIRSDEKYDVIVMEHFVNEAFFVFAHKFKCPVVLISTFGTTTAINRIFGNSAPYSYVPLEFLTLDDKMTVFERLRNTLGNIFVDITRKYYYMPLQQALAVKYLGDSGVEIPDLEKIERQADFILINSHPAFYTPRPYMANMKDVGGLHLKPAKPLPLDLQQYLDSSQNGVILFSLGSAMQSTMIPEHFIQVLKRAFESLPFDVLWKWENDTMTDKPINVRIEKWLPQNDVLAHPNLKLFITHGGICSLMETVYHGVPIVGIPLFGDQPRNILLVQKRGYGESLDLLTLTEKQIQNVVMKVASKPEYKENIKKISAYWRDQLNHPLDEAVYWVEYVVKHNGAKHLKAAVTEQTFVQYLLLDIALVIVGTLFSTFFVIHQTFKLLYRSYSSKKKMRFIAICVLLCLMGHEGFGAKILGLFPYPGRSHLSITSSLMHGLARKGHNVTAFVPNATGLGTPNYKEINYKAVPVTGSTHMLDYLSTSFFVKHFKLYEIGITTTEKALNTSEARDLIRSEEKYDVIIMEEFVNEAFYVFAHKFKCPVILIHTFGTNDEKINVFFQTNLTDTKEFDRCITFFHLLLSLGDKMTLSERIQNSLQEMLSVVTRELYYMPRQQALAVKYLGDSGVEIPDLQEIAARQTRFILINNHPVFYTPRPYMENMKNVGGLHLKPAKPLPLDLQQYLDSSQNGVILFSLGSSIQSVQMPERFTEALKKAFQRSPFDVLWKWENDTMARKSSNVRIEKWLPQNDILAHPNVKMFITHGGISSMMEAVYHGVPIIGIPLFGDQMRNILLAVSKGYAESLDFFTTTDDQVYDTIMKVATDSKYKENVKKVSACWRDDLNHPLDRAIYWVEYVVKHDGVKHLKAAVTEQTFVQYLLLDVAFVILTTLVLSFFAIRQMFRLLWRHTYISIYKISSFEDNLKKLD